MPPTLPTERSRRPAWLWAPYVIATVWSIVGAAQASRTIDGQRYFWLDDDQMVSMRYARNLADGAGLVWNPGEYVEGYSNFLWTLVMAAVHSLPLSDAKTALGVHVINWALVMGVLALSDRLVRRLAPQAELARGALLFTLAMASDVLFWSTNGFEVPLMSVLVLGVLVLSTAPQLKLVPLATLIALIPLVRADGIALWAAASLPVLVLHQSRRRTLLALGVTLLPFALHLAFRQLYYGDWFPNTYYLKVVGNSERLLGGVRYVGRWTFWYGPALVLALAGLLRRVSRSRKRTALTAVIGVQAVYVVVAGGDIFPCFRFMAPVLPLVFVLAYSACVPGVVVRPRLMAAVAFLSCFTMVGVFWPSRLRDENGLPADALPVALAIRDNARPDASILVVGAGTVPYFSRRRCIDLLGLTDATIARGNPNPNGAVAHNKYDVAYSLRRRPDFIVPLVPYAELRRRNPPDLSRHLRPYDLALYTHPAVRGRYTVHERIGYGDVSLLVRNDSPDAARVSAWRLPKPGG